jgi:cytochrome c-type biogenesis protein CcmH
MFWLVSAWIAAIVVGLLLIRMRRSTDTDDDVALDISFYKDQLTEIDRDLERGVLSQEDAERARTDISRKILKLDAQNPTIGTSDTSRAPLWVMALLAVVLLGGSFGVYNQLGQPGYNDVPLQLRKEFAQKRLEERPSQQDILDQLPASLGPNTPEGDYGQLVVKLRETTATRPNDLEGFELLARIETQLENFNEASRAKGRVIAIKGSEATANDYLDYAESLIIAANGYVSPSAEAALKEALNLDRENGGALYYTGLMMAQNDRPDLTFRIWRKLLNDGPNDAPWIAPIRSQMMDMAYLAGQHKYQLPPETTLRGPTSEDIEAASGMDAEDRNAMIQGMVAQLSDRLATQGGTAQEWARLINAYGVLGEIDQARAIVAEARTVFAANPQDLDLINAAADSIGLAQ